MIKKWHVYEDWTLESIPRCFYVGKGNDDRVSKLKRSNEKHTDICKKFGINRVVVASDTCEKNILDIERNVIRDRHTYMRDPQYNGIGCNRTVGGQGNSGRIVSKETGLKISNAKRGKKPNKIWTQAERDAMSVRMSILHKGKKLSQEHIDICKARMADSEIKQSMIEKVRVSINLKYQDPEFRQHILETRARGSKNANSIFIESEIIQIRNEWDLIEKRKGNRSSVSPQWQFCSKWATLKNVTKNCIFAIATRKTWKHLP